MTIKTQIPNNNYRENWDNIFNKEDKKKCKNQQCLCTGACKSSDNGLDHLSKHQESLKKQLDS